jgi:hypothetical protein
VTGNDGDDVVGQGGERRRRPGWLSRGSLILAIVTLAVGLVAGYATGYRHVKTGAAGTSAARPSAAGTSPSAKVKPRYSVSLSPLGAVSPALTQTIAGCSAQVGRDLQLGVQATNQSAAPVTIDRIKAVLPLGGLRAVSQQWGPCGALPALQEASGNVLAAGASTWFTVTFKVLIRGCPGPLPVQFTVDYQSNGQSAAVTLPGFPDLGQVAYSGCPTS